MTPAPWTRPTAAEAAAGRVAAARVRLELAQARARRLGLDPVTSPDCAAKARRLAELEHDEALTPPPPPTVPEPRPRRDIDGPPEE